MYELYYAPGVCSMSVHVCLEELGVEYKLHKIDLQKGEQRSPEFLKINPRGQVGALKTPEGVITENAAMIIYLNEKHNGNVLPHSGYERAIALQWLMFANSSMHPAYSKVLFAKRNNAGDEAVKAAEEGVQKLWNEVERHLNESGTDYLAGNEATAGDFYVAVMANWMFMTEPKFGSKTKEYLKRVTSRETFQAALAQENVEYKAAA